MKWIEFAPSIAVLAALITMWWQLSSRIDTLNKLLTDNLIVLNRDIGELKGAARHTSYSRAVGQQHHVRERNLSRD